MQRSVQMQTVVTQMFLYTVQFLCILQSSNEEINVHMYTNAKEMYIYTNTLDQERIL